MFQVAPLAMNVDGLKRAIRAKLGPDYTGNVAAIKIYDHQGQAMVYPEQAVSLNTSQAPYLYQLPGCRGFILFHPQGLVLCRACALGSFEEEIQRRNGLVIVSAGIIRASVDFFVWRWARGVLTCSFLRVDIRLHREGGGWAWKKQSWSGPAVLSCRGK